VPLIKGKNSSWVLLIFLLFLKGRRHENEREEGVVLYNTEGGGVGYIQ
jgi:hypothetical protein